MKMMVTLHVFVSTECSNNAQVPYEGERIIRANAAYKCSWVLTVPENYTVKLTITQKNVGSVGNTNCAIDYIQVISKGHVAALYRKLIYMYVLKSTISRRRAENENHSTECFRDTRHY